MTDKSEVESIELLSGTVEKLLGVVPPDEAGLRDTLVAVRADAQQENGNSVYWWKRLMQLFGNRVLEIRQTVEPDARPAWIREARDIIEKARG